MTKQQTIKEWLLEEYEDEPETINEIARQGCASGACNSLIYYGDTSKAYYKHETEIWEFLFEDANNNGMTIMEFIASFNGQKNVCDEYQLRNLLVWYAVEREAINIINERENENG